MTKEEQIQNYAVEMFLELEEAGVYLKPEEQKAFVDQYVNREGSLEDIVSTMLRDARQLRGSHDQRNNLEKAQEAPVLEQEQGKKLTYQPPRGNGFVNVFIIAVAIGGLIGILLAFILMP